MLSCAISRCPDPNNSQGLGRIKHGVDNNGISQYCKNYFHNDCIQAYLKRHQGICLCEEVAPQDSFEPQPIHFHPEPGLSAEEGYQPQQSVGLPNEHRTKYLDKFLQKGQSKKYSTQNDKIPFIRVILEKAFDNAQEIRLGVEYEFGRNMDEIYFLGGYGTSLETLNKATFHYMIGGFISMTEEWKLKVNCADFETYKRQICIYVMKIKEYYEEYKRINEINVLKRELLLNVAITGGIIGVGVVGGALFGAIVARGLAALRLQIPLMPTVLLSGTMIGLPLGILMNQCYNEIDWNGEKLLFAKDDFMTRFYNIIRKEKDDQFLKMLYDGENFDAINHPIVRNYFTVNLELKKKIDEAKQKAATELSSSAE